ncbi:MAG: tyrosine-type recombinase/integrase [Planctomycetes bacterium]|nr:tyrosine-type recombinase/integrase [Planctomycetota bacterium]
MFERILKDPKALARHQNGPLAEERRRYLFHCAAKEQTTGETLHGLANYLLVIAEALRLDKRPGELISPDEVDAEVHRWIHRPRRKNVGKLQIAFRNRAIRWLTYLGRMQLPPSVQRPFADYVAQFTEHLCQERGLAPGTVALCERTIHGFLGTIHKARLRLKTLTVAQVNDLLAKDVQDRGFARSTVSRQASVLREFIRFGEKRNWFRQGLADGIQAPRVYRHEGLPVGPSWDDVKRLLTAAEGDRPTDIRDRAILMLLAVYGLRAGEVVTLRLEDFDWKHEVLNVPHGKRKKPRTYPLCRPVGDAVLRYLCEVRPRTDYREVFLTRIAPIKPMDPCAVGEMVQKRLHALGLTLPHYGSHVLRHACATHLQSQGLSLKEIGDHLGHRSPETTRIYAKVDLAALRAVGDFNLEGLL